MQVIWTEPIKYVNGLIGCRGNLIHGEKQYRIKSYKDTENLDQFTIEIKSIDDSTRARIKIDSNDFSAEHVPHGTNLYLKREIADEEKNLLRLAVPTALSAAKTALESERKTERKENWEKLVHILTRLVEKHKLTKDS